MRVLVPAIPVALLSVILAACSQRGNPVSISETPQSIVARVENQMKICWFRKANPTLAKYKIASEINSYTGKPRILLVPRNRPGGLPGLVVQAERRSGGNDVQVFGPLLEGSGGANLRASVNKWTSGSTAC